MAIIIRLDKNDMKECSLLYRFYILDKNILEMKRKNCHMNLKFTRDARVMRAYVLMLLK